MKTRSSLCSFAALAVASAVGALWPAGDALAARNIIVFIGDGMGPDHVKAGRWFRNAPAVPLTFETMPCAGEAITVLPGGGITDSATAGTAMSTGYQHPSSGTIAIDTTGAIRETILEMAKEAGYATGILTTDDITGATPASFGAHEASRTETAEIRQDYLVDEADAGDAFHYASRPNVLMGGGFLADYAAQAAGLGYDVVTDAAYLGDTTSHHVMGLFGSTVFTAEYANPPASQPTLGQMVTNAVAQLSGSGAPFFLMVEGALIDKLSHSNIAEGIGPEVDQLDLAVGAALAWRAGTAVPDDTLVIVTADHETGGLTVSDTGVLTFASGDHTTRNVPIYATWPAALAGKIIDNTETFFIMEDFLASGVPPAPEAAAAADLASTSARITWTTREPSTSELFQDGNLLSSDAARVTSHSVPLSGLQPSTTYTVLVSSTDLAGNTGTAPVTFTTPAQSAIVTLVPAGSYWKYSATGTNLATAWRARTYNDSAWPGGPAQLGYGDGDEATLVPKTSPVYSCYYFRHTFNVADPNALSDLKMRLLRDDGAVVYLNGTEVARYNMPTGTIAFGTWATTGSEFGWDPELAIPGGRLVPGQNVLAVEIHQSSSTSTDISLDLELKATYRDVATLVPLGSLWKYEAGGTDLGTAWRATAYDDAGWPGGPSQLGYGDGDEATVVPKTSPGYPCYYFRHRFQVADPAALSDLTLRLLRDDGAVVYLNGTEIARYSLPAGAISYTNWATTSTNYDWDPAVAVPGNLLVAGENVLAVEIHQCNSTSSDISLDLVLSAAGSVQPNSRPVADAQAVTLAEDAQAAVTLTGSDADNDPLTFRVTTGPAHGTLGGTAPDLTYTPAANYAGPDSFAFVVNDGVQDSEAATVSITVTPVNDAPAANDQSLVLAEDTPSSITLLGSDPDGDPLTYRITTAPVNGTLSGTPPSLVYTPAANYAGPDSFAFVANDGAQDSAAATVSITVTPVNDAPVANAQDVTLAEDTPASITLAGSDVENPALTYRVTAGPAHGTLGGTAPDLTYTPAANYAGPDSFAFVVNDGVQDSEAATVSITVTPVNDAPVANAQDATLAEDTPASIALAASDPDDDPLTYRITTAPVNGTLGGTPPSLVYTPAANYAGPDSFAFVANDGAQDSAPATVSITVTPVNDAPVANAQDVTLAEDTPASITLAGSDVENSALTYRVTTGPAHGTLGGTAPDLTYTPAANYAGPDSFAFVVNDGTADSAPATVTLDVTAVNDDPPTAPQGVTATPGDARVGLSWSASTDPDVGSTLTYSVFRRLEGEAVFGDPVATGLTDTTWEDTGVANGATYVYKVRCVDDTARFADSAEVSATPAGVDPTAYVAAAPTLSAGTVSGDFNATRVLDGTGQVLAESRSGLTGVLDAQYLLHTAADPTLINGLTLHAGVISGTWNDPWKVFIWNGTAWEDITAAILASGTFLAAAPQSYVDAAGDIRVRFTDGAAIKREALDSLTVDWLKAEITAGTPPTEPPAAPAGLTAQAVSVSAIALAWTDQADNEQSYEVERSPDGAAWQTVATLAANATGFTDSGLAADTLYFYRVRALNTVGASAYSAVASARTNAEAPLNAPSNLVAKALPKQKISLTWVDNSSDETGFRVERSLDGVTFASRASLAAGVVTYTDTGLTVGTTYYYRVVAVRGATVSAPSNVSSALAK